MRATRSRSADARRDAAGRTPPPPPLDRIRGALGSHGGYRFRLALALALVVILALGILVLSVPRLLDDYLRTQDREALGSRAEAVAELVASQIRTVTTTGQDFQRPVIMETQAPPVPSDTLIAALGTPARGFLADLTERIALADLRVEIWESPAARQDGRSPVYQLSAPLSTEVVRPGSQRESLRASATVLVPDRYWSQASGEARRRPVVVTLSDPWSSRAASLDAVGRILVVAAVIGLLASGIVALLLTQWLADPINRLIRSARRLAEGELDVRASVPESAAPEVRELGEALNQVAERLGGSIATIRADRDRSRDFVADVSHELRTPIAALRTFNELLIDGAAEDPATREEFLEQSRRQIERLDWLASNLLELSKIDSGLITLDLRPGDLRGVVEAAFQQAEPVAVRKGVELVVEMPEAPVRLPHDPPRLGQVVANLVGNAVKFTPAGGRVTITLTETLEGARIAVTDTGIGIPADEIPHLFERFWRGSRSPERGSGSGLGLAIARSITELHGGRIEVVSEPGAGSTFTLSLPARAGLPPGRRTTGREPA